MFKVLKIMIISTTIFLVFFVIVFFGAFFHLKNIYSNVLAGKEGLEISAELMKSREFERALEKSQESYENFTMAIEALENIQSNIIFSNIETSNKILTEVSYILFSGQNLSKAGILVSELGEKALVLMGGDFERNFESLNISEKRDLIQAAYESSPEFYGISANIELSIDSLSKINSNGIFYPIKSQIAELQNRLEDANKLLLGVLPLVDILPKLAGYPEKSNYLFVLQNNDELRPTGGFIGTYGLLQMDSGEIKRIETKDIYHLDMPVKDLVNITPPEPLVKYLGVSKWYMRDSNWSPDWRESAEKIQWFYKLENSKFPKPDEMNEFVGVIGLTPDFIIDLLEFTGPLEVGSEVYTKENFMDLLQYKVEREYYDLGIPEWHRKDEIGVVMEKLKKELLSLPLGSLSDVVKIINTNLAEKNILFYFNDSAIHDLAKMANYTGEINETKDDFFMVVDANMAAYKTDAVMGKSIDYSLDQGKNGMFAKLKVNYSHRGSFDWKTTRYRSYTRVYVPKGSELIKSWSGSEDDVLVYDEGDKTVFASFISIEPGKINNLYFEYKLPEDIHRKSYIQKEYNLYAQKQPGSKIEELNINLNFDSIIRSYEPTGFFVNTEKDNQIKWVSNLNTDREFSLKF